MNTKLIVFTFFLLTTSTIIFADMNNMQGSGSQMNSGNMMQQDMMRNITPMMNQMQNTMREMTQMMNDQQTMNMNRKEMADMMEQLSQNMHDMSEQIQSGKMDKKETDKMQKNMVQMEKKLEHMKNK